MCSRPSLFLPPLLLPSHVCTATYLCVCRDEALAAVAQARIDGDAAGRAALEGVRASVAAANAAKIEEATQRAVQFKEKALGFFAGREEEVR